MSDTGTDLPEISFEQLAALPADTPAGHIRRALVHEALADPVWVEQYRRRRSTGERYPEQRMVAPFAVALAAAGLLRSEDLRPKRNTHPCSPRRRLRPPRRRRDTVALSTALGATIVAMWAALCAVNPHLPTWYAGWTDMGAAVTAGGIATTFAMFGAAAGLIVGFGEPRSRVIAAYASTSLLCSAIHPLGASLPGVLCLAARLRRAMRGRRDRRALPVTPVIAAAARSMEDRWSEPVPRMPWGTLAHDPQRAAAALRERAAELLGPGKVVVDTANVGVGDVDNVAAVVAAESWLIATDALEFEQAASLGPASVGSFAAILARACGRGESVVNPFPGEHAWPTTREPLEERVRQIRRWARSFITDAEWSEALRRAASDLGWGGGGDDRCARAARHLASL